MRNVIRSIATTVLLALTLISSASGGNVDQHEMRTLPSEQSGTMPLAFTENQGQWDERVLFRADAKGTVLWFCRDGVYQQHIRPVAVDKSHSPDQLVPFERPLSTGSAELLDRELTSGVLKASFIGANPNPQIVGEEPMEYRCNYFIGNDPDKWRTDVPNYRAIRYKDVYPEIDVRFYGGGGNLCYDIIAEPDANRSVIKFSCGGTDAIQGDAGGQLGLAPVQTEMAETAATRGLIFATYLGGTYNDLSYDVSTDAAGNAYVTGYTGSVDFPTVNPWDDTRDFIDAYVTKFSPDGAVMYSTFLGGSSSDNGCGVACDASGNAAVVGFTGSDDFPTVHAHDDTYAGGEDVFVAVFSPDGSSLLYGTYLGGDDQDRGCDVDIWTDWIYVTGRTISTTFPTMNPVQATIGSDTAFDAFATVLAPGSEDNLEHVFSTYFGGTDLDRGHAIAAGPDGMLHISGYTRSVDMPTANAFQDFLYGGGDAYLAKIDPFTGSYVFSTYCGGNGQDYGNDVAVDQPTGKIYFTGSASNSFPITEVFGNTGRALPGMFAARFSPDGSDLEFSTVISGNGVDQGYGIALCADGSACMVAVTTSSDLPTVGAFDDSFNGVSDAYIARFSPDGTTLSYSTYLGGSDMDAVEFGVGIAVDPECNIIIAMHTYSDDCPTVNAFDPDMTGNFDGFVAKIEPPPPYICGDADGSGGVDIDDVVYLIAYIFSGGPEPVPYEAGDADCSGAIDIDDVVYLIAYIFSGGPAPGDPNDDGVLDC